jgi:hypothetical protein
MVTNADQPAFQPMNVYKLDDKIMDAVFLKGDVVACRAVLTPAELREGRIREGEPILVLLSNGAKYKGLITAFNYVLIDEHAVGELEIQRIMTGGR